MQIIEKKVKKLFCLLVLAILMLIALPLSVTAVEEMPIPATAGNCYRCHDPASHPASNCDGCHDKAVYEPSAGPPGGHGGLNVTDTSKLISTAPVGNCQVCHAYTDPWATCWNCHPSLFAGWGPPPNLVLNPNTPWPEGYTHDSSRVDNFIGVDTMYTCEKCHIQDWWQSIPEHDTSFGSPSTHLSSTTGCQTCHSTPLTTEHYRHLDDTTGMPLDCFTCHSSPAAEVKAAVVNKNTGCNDCHSQLHTTSTIPSLPGDILLYPGLAWSSPIELSIWHGEPWVEGNSSGYRVIFSNRSSLSGDEVWSYYRDSLTARGWSAPAEPTAIDSGFKAAFVKGSEKLAVWFYSAENPSGSRNVYPGSRIALVFKG